MYVMVAVRVTGRDGALLGSSSWIKRVQQFSSLITVFAIISIFSARLIVEADGGGKWWPALGTLFGWAFAFFFVFHTVLYFLVRAMRGRNSISSYTSSKVNCISALVTILATVAIV